MDRDGLQGGPGNAMVGMSTRRQAPVQAHQSALALAVADVNWFTTENLFGELEREDVRLLLLKCVDYQVAWRHGMFPWDWGKSLSSQRPGQWTRELVLPSGWMKRFPRLGMRPIRRVITDWRAHHAPDGRLALVMTYPHYLYLRDQVRPDLSVYLNIDDYSQYWPRCAGRVNELERQAVREADLTVCVSHRRFQQLRAEVPSAEGKIHHLPHGAPRAVIAPVPRERPTTPPSDLAHLPRPLLGYVGTLEERLDWELLDGVAGRFPHASVVLIGQLGRERGGAWLATRRRCLSRGNVHAIGWRPQRAIGAYNQSFDVCLIPYLTDHPFNVVCCPTKIMDYMGATRPVVSTDLPECRLHSPLLRIADDTESYLDAIGEILQNGSDDGLAPARLEWARQNSCARVAERFLDSLLSSSK